MRARINIKGKKKKGGGRYRTYHKWDDSVHCRVLPISAANEAYERSQDAKCV
jgi:hypothetical protein